MTARTNRRRGYLIAEVMVASGIAGAALLTAAIGISNMNHQRNVAMRENLSAQLLSQSLEQAVAAGYTQIASGAWPTVASETLSYGTQYDRSIAVGGGTEPSPSGTINVKVVTVTVAFTDARGFLHNRVASVRIYDDDMTDAL